MLHGRKRLSSALVGIGALLVVGLVPASPSAAEPEIADVKARVDTLYRQAEQASERYNDVRLELEALRGDLDSLAADERRQRAEMKQARIQVEDSVVRQYQGQAISTVGQVVVSEDPSEFLAQLSTMSAYQDLQADLFDDYATELEALELRSDATRARSEQVAALEEQLAQEKSAIDAKVDEAEKLLSRLEEDERERMLAASRSEPTAARSTAPAVEVSGRAGAAVQYALAQVGDAYVYGAAGPDAFDCSGLTMMAWAQAGVALPHSSSAQISTGTPVSASDLRPGDLVAYYSPISHIGIYIGGGKIVDAANPGTGVRVADVFSMPFTAAVRPG